MIRRVIALHDSIAVLQESCEWLPFPEHTALPFPLAIERLTFGDVKRQQINYSKSKAVLGILKRNWDKAE